MHKPMRFIQEKVDVAEPDKTRTHGSRPERPHRPEGVVFLAGVAGSGRGDLGRLAAQRLGIPFRSYNGWAAAGRDRAVVALDEADIELEGGPERVRSLGTVFYLMSGAPAVAERLLREHPGEDADSLRARAAEHFFAAEPVFMSALHFLLQGFRPLEEQVRELLDKLRL
ncbi:hypothetical protein [Desulfovibrio aminophilus]|uniref:hypothetical protein n=1 Tax=Desulfovibrio aminophilus TaxID=81425 RepID=UPI0033960FD3